MHERAFAEFRGKMKNYFPELDELLDAGPGGLEDWWGAVKDKAEELQPGLGAAMGQIDFVGMYNKNEAIPDDCVIPFIPFRFHVFAAATTMTRDEYVDLQTAKAKDLRSAILASDDAPGALLALAADEQVWVDLYLAALEDAELLRPDGETPPIRTQQHIVSLMAVISSGILFGPAGSAVRSDADLVGFFEQVRQLYGHEQFRLAEIEFWDPRESDCYVGEVPVPAIPQFEDYDLNLTSPTHFEAFRIYVPWMPFEDRGAGIPPEFQINGPEEVGGDAFVTLDFGKILKGSSGEGRLASITGPQTFDTAGWLPIDQALPYTINFENSASASRYVNELQIVTQLDADLDPYTFQLGDITIGDITIDVPEGRWSFQQDFDFTYTKGFVLRVSAGIDTYQNPAGVSWVLQAIDPLTGELLQDATRGLLAPNDALGKGAGFVSYTVEARSPDEVKVTDKTPLNQRPDGIVKASARVLYDTQAPEDTLVLEQRVDAVAPITQLAVSAHRRQRQLQAWLEHQRCRRRLGLQACHAVRRRRWRRLQDLAAPPRTGFGRAALPGRGRQAIRVPRAGHRRGRQPRAADARRQRAVRRRQCQSRRVAAGGRHHAAELRPAAAAGGLAVHQRGLRRGPTGHPQRHAADTCQRVRHRAAAFRRRALRRWLRDRPRRHRADGHRRGARRLDPGLRRRQPRRHLALHARRRLGG